MEHAEDLIKILKNPKSVTEFFAVSEDTKTRYVRVLEEFFEQETNI
jgi:hypothetical protein